MLIKLSNNKIIIIILIPIHEAYYYYYYYKNKLAETQGSKKGDKNYNSFFLYNYNII